MKIGIVLHITATNHWKDWVKFLISELAISGLIKTDIHIHATLKGLPADLAFLQRSLFSIGVRSEQIRYYLQPLDSIDITEYSSLKIIEWLNTNSSIDYICYLHSKGVTYSRSQDPAKSYKVQEWALQMLSSIIGSWKEHLSKLQSNPRLYIAGCNIEKKPKLHFSGNTFWLKSNCPLTPLIMPNELEKEDSDPKARWRLYYEFWVCSSLNYENLVEAGRTHKQGLIGYHYSNWSE